MVEKTIQTRKCEQCGNMTHYRVRLTGVFVCFEDECLKWELPRLEQIITVKDNS